MFEFIENPVTFLLTLVTMDTHGRLPTTPHFFFLSSPFGFNKTSGFLLLFIHGLSCQTNMFFILLYVMTYVHNPRTRWFALSSSTPMFVRTQSFRKSSASCLLLAKLHSTLGFACRVLIWPTIFLIWALSPYQAFCLLHQGQERWWFSHWFSYTLKGQSVSQVLQYRLPHLSPNHIPGICGPWVASS